MTGSLLGFFILASQPRMHAQPQSALARSCAAAIALRLVLFDQDCIRMELVFPFDLESPRHSTFDVYGPACHVKTAFVSCHDIIASSVSSGASHVHQIQHHKRHHHQQTQHHHHIQQWTPRCKDGDTDSIIGCEGLSGILSSSVPISFHYQMIIIFRYASATTEISTAYFIQASRLRMHA